VGHQPRRLQVGREVGDAVLERLEGPDRAVELAALLHIQEEVVKGALGDPQHRRREDQPLDVEPGHQLHPALVDRAEDVLLGSGAIGEVEVVGLAAAHRLDRDHLHPLDVARDPDHRQALVLAAATVGPADDEDVVGDVGVGAEDLLAVEHEAAVDALGLAGEGADVGPGLGLGHRDRLDRAGGDAAEDLLLLRVAAEALGGPGDDQRRRITPDRRQPPRGLLHEQAGVEHRPARTAELLGNRDAEPAELRHLVVDVEVVVLAVAVRQPLALIGGAALAIAEIPDRVDEILLLVAQGEVHRSSLTS
jgi:hypothetical protein